MIATRLDIVAFTKFLFQVERTDDFCFWLNSFFRHRLFRLYFFNWFLFRFNFFERNFFWFGLFNRLNFLHRLSRFFNLFSLFRFNFRFLFGLFFFFYRLSSFFRFRRILFLFVFTDSDPSFYSRLSNFAKIIRYFRARAIFTRHLAFFNIGRRGGQSAVFFVLLSQG